MEDKIYDGPFHYLVNALVSAGMKEENITVTFSFDAAVDDVNPLIVDLSKFGASVRRAGSVFTVTVNRSTAEKVMENTLYGGPLTASEAR